MDKIMDSPWFLRFTALFLAILLFYTVQVDQKETDKNASNEDMEMIRDIPVEVYYDDENLIVTGVPQSVNMTIEGPANIVQTTKVFKDFTLFVDLRSLHMGEHEVEINHENISDKLQVRIDPSTIDVNIEERITETFKVEPEFNERLLAEGYNIVGMEVEPSTIEVTGAKSVVESINFVKATVSADNGVKESFEQQATVRVLDRDLTKLDIEMVPETVRVKVEIQENAKDVPIVLNETGTPQDGVTVNSITPEKDEITLSGPSRVLDEIDQLLVDFDLSKITKSGTVEVALEKPKDVLKLSAKTLKVKVDVQVEGAEERPDSEPQKEEVSQETEEPERTTETTETKETVSKFEDMTIVVNGLNSDFKSSILEPADGTLTLTVSAPAGQEMNIKREDFTITIDASNVEEEGEYRYPILVKGPVQTDWVLSTDEALLKVELA